MLRVRPAACAVLACLCVPLLASCASTVNGTGYPAGAAPTGTAHFPRTTAALAAFMHHGAHSITSAHLDLRVDLGTTSVTANGDETLQNGKAKDLSLTEQIPQFGTLKLIIADGVTYAQLPHPPDPSKPWTKLTASTSDPTLHVLYESLAQSRQMASVDSTTLFVHAADHLRYHGTRSVAGTTVGDYSLAVEIDRLPNSYPQKSTLQQAGLHSIPLRLQVDSQGRPRHLTEKISVAGQTVDTEVTLGNFDAPVHISAPPPDQVSDH